MPIWIGLVILGIALICLAKYVLGAPFNNWAFGAGVFCIAVAAILFVYGLVAGGGLRLA